MQADFGEPLRPYLQGSRPAIVGTVVSPEAVRSTLRLVPR